MFLDIVVGILVLIGSFFTLPVRWIKETGSRLAEIGERRSVVVEQTEDVPLLSWLLVCGRMVIALAAILVYPATTMPMVGAHCSAPLRRRRSWPSRRAKRDSPPWYSSQAAGRRRTNLGQG